MEPTIYKPGAYKSPGIYNGACGVYNGLGVYKDGAGGGSPIPPEYTAYDWIRFDGAGGSLNWLIHVDIDIVDNENCEFVIKYKLENHSCRMLFIADKPNASPDYAFLEIGSGDYGTKTAFNLKNGNTDIWLTPYAALSYFTDKSEVSFINGKVKDFTTDSVLCENAGTYSKISLLNKWLFLGYENNYKFKIYGGMIIKNGITLYEFVPVKENDTGKCGIYDIVNNVFTTFIDPAAFSHWTAGNDT